MFLLLFLFISLLILVYIAKLRITHVCVRTYKQRGIGNALADCSIDFAESRGECIGWRQGEDDISNDISNEYYC